MVSLPLDALTLAINKELHLIGIVVVAPHIDIVAWNPVPVGEEVQHRFRGPLALIHVIGILGEACEVDDTEVARTCREAVGRGFSDIVEARPDILSSTVGRMLHHIPCLLVSTRP